MHAFDQVSVKVSIQLHFIKAVFEWTLYREWQLRHDDNLIMDSSSTGLHYSLWQALSIEQM